MSKLPINRTVIILSGFAFLSACASKPPEVIDNSPLVRAAVVTSTIQSNGFKGQFGSDTVHVRKTLADKQRIDNDFKFTGSIMSRVAGKLSQSEILRLDKNIEWQLDNRKKRYRECEIGKCFEQAGFKAGLFPEETAQETEQQEAAADSCQLTTTKNDFSITTTGQQREVNGFPAQQYKVNWEMGFKDPEGKTALNIITVDLWTTPRTGTLAEALAMEKNFADALSSREEYELPSNVIDAMPNGSMEMLWEYLLSNFDENEMRKIRSSMGNATPITGFPISTKLQWDGKNETCAAPAEAEEEEKDGLNTGSLKGLLASVGKQVIKQEVKKKRDAKLREIAMQPLMLIVEEVTSIEIKDIRESQLSVPANYKIKNRS